MANLKISQMGKADALTGAELIPIVKDNENKSATVDLIIKDLATISYVDNKIKKDFTIPLSWSGFEGDLLEEDILFLFNMTKEELLSFLKDIIENKYNFIRGKYYNLDLNSILKVGIQQYDSNIYFAYFSIIDGYNVYTLSLNNSKGAIVGSVNEITLIKDTNIIDNLEGMEETTLPLSANQGYILNETKANKTDVYTKAEVDALIAAINK